MQTLTKTLTALGLVLSMGLLSAPDAFAKGHDQNTMSSKNDTDPGENVGEETVGPAQGLGKASSGGKGKGPGDTPAGDSPGNSGDAGR